MLDTVAMLCAYTSDPGACLQGRHFAQSNEHVQMCDVTVFLCRFPPRILMASMVCLLQLKPSQLTLQEAGPLHYEFFVRGS